MKNSPRKLSLLATLALFGFSPILTLAAKEEKPAAASIRASGSVKPVDLPALAKISFQTAVVNALKAAPGSIIKAELEVEDGNLMYSFEIVGADKKITEVEIDAGNGKVLGMDKDDEKDEKPEKK